MKLYTYYATCPTHAVEDELRLLILWRNHWTALGWEAVVLNEYHARAHPYFEEFNAAVQALPTVNSKEYEVACYHRWLAMAQVDGIAMSDYDVFARNQEAASAVYQIIMGPGKDKLRVLQTNNCVPSFVVGTGVQYLDQCRRFAAYQLRPEEQQSGRPHVSDMYILEHRAVEEPESLTLVDAVRCWNDRRLPGYDEVPLLHFSNSVMRPAEMTPRWKCIPQLLQ